MSHYCETAPGDPWDGPYHDREYGFPTEDETELFERLALEIFQAGLSWKLILKKRAALNRAFNGFDVDVVARFGDGDRARLLADAEIVRNRLKIGAIIENAKRIQDMRQSHGTFAAWLACHHPLTKPEWVKLFKRTFKFTGGEITGEFLMSVGYLPGAHLESCPIFKALDGLSPPWRSVPVGFYKDAV